MTRASPLSRWIALAGLVLMIVLLLMPAPTPWTVTISVPLAIFIVTALKPPPRWGGWVSAFMVPYLAGALGEALADPDGRIINSLTAGLSVVVFFASIDFVRRTGVSLRR